MIKKYIAIAMLKICAIFRYSKKDMKNKKNKIGLFICQLKILLCACAGANCFEIKCYLRHSTRKFFSIVTFFVSPQQFHSKSYLTHALIKLISFTLVGAQLDIPILTFS